MEIYFNPLAVLKGRVAVSWVSPLSLTQAGAWGASRLQQGKGCQEKWLWQLQKKKLT